jgi:hypothetical protein
VRREAHPAATQFRVTSHYVRLAAAVLNSAKRYLTDFAVIGLDVHWPSKVPN